MSDPGGPTVSYAGGALYVRRCPHCGRIVKADPSIFVNGLDEVAPGDNADCRRCGRVEMPFEGWFEEVTG